MTLNCKGSLIDLDIPKVMGILNLTPDSFYDGGKYKNQDEILSQTTKMLKEGATFIDVGGYSSRPGATHISEEEETQRVLPVIELLLKEFPEILISIDTFRSGVAKKSIEAGAALINDISAGNLDEKMMKIVADLQVPYIIMHMRGTPKTMKTHTHYENLIQEILFYFSEKTAEARNLGINDIIIDPGFGFAKTPQQGFKILKHLKLFSNLECPVLVGLSRKSMICESLGISPNEALNGTSILNSFALYGGASILRVHDVKEVVEAVKLYDCVLKA